MRTVSPRGDEVTSLDLAYLGIQREPRFLY